MGNINKVEWKFKSTLKDQRYEDEFVHIGFNAFGYATLCGLGDEGVSNGYRKEPNYLHSTTKKVSCSHCLEIYNFCKTAQI